MVSLFTAHSKIPASRLLPQQKHELIVWVFYLRAVWCHTRTVITWGAEEFLKGPLCQACRGKHAGQMWPCAKIRIASLKGLFNVRPNEDEYVDHQQWGSRRKEFWEWSEYTHTKKHTWSLGSLGCVFYQNQCQCVQENTIHVTGSGFSRIYYRQWGGRSALMDGTVPLVGGTLICGGPETQWQIQAAALLFEFRRQTNHDLAHSF